MGVPRFGVGRRGVIARVSRVSQGRNADTALLQFASSTAASERNNASRLASFLSRADIGRIDPQSYYIVTLSFGRPRTGEPCVPRADCWAIHSPIEIPFWRTIFLPPGLGFKTAYKPTRPS